MKMIKLILIFSGLLWSCNSKTFDDLEGNWAIEILHCQNKDIFGIDTRHGNIQFALPLRIESRNHIVIFDEGKKAIFARYKCHLENNAKYITIYKADDSRLNGEYSMSLKQLPKENEIITSYELELKSAQCYIYAEKETSTVFSNH